MSTPAHLRASKAYYARNVGEHRRRVKAWSVSNPTRFWASQIRNSATTRTRKSKQPLTISIDWVHSRILAGVCEVSGVPFVLTPRSPWVPSLDQRIPGLGYTEDNTRVVVWLYNSAKQSFSDEDVMTLARSLVNHEHHQKDS